MGLRTNGVRAVLVAASCGLLALPAGVRAGVNDMRVGELAPRMAGVIFPTNRTVVKGDAVRVRVRLRAGVRSFRAWLDTREVTRAFRRSGARRVASLRTPLGVNHLHFRVRDGAGRRDFDTVRFVRARRAPGLMRVRLPARRAMAGRLRVTVALGRGADRARGWLNGRRLRRVGGSWRRRALVLDGDHGLRFGSNRLRFVAVDEAGRHDIERRSVFVTRARPIPATGAPGRVRQRRVVTLDARRTLATGPRRELAFSWRFVERPKGSRARLRGAHRPRPRFKPDRPGRYRIRLVVRELAGAGARSAAASRRSVDVATIAAAPDVPPIGVPINTVNPEGVTLGAPINESYAPPDPTQPLQLVVLDRGDLSPQYNQSYAGDANGTNDLLNDLRSYVGDLAIIATPWSHSSQAVDDDQTALDNLNSALAAIGSRDLNQYVATNSICDQGSCSNFSAIGVPRTTTPPGGGGTLNPGLNLAPNGDSPWSYRGDLRGYLQFDSNSLFTYVNGDYVPFNTAAPGSTDQQAVIQVGGDRYTPPALAPGQAGFTVLVLDAGKLTYRNAGTFAVSGVSAATAASNLQAMDSMLATAAGDPTALTFIQSLGAVGRVDSAVKQWNAVMTDQTSLGGHGYYLNALDGSSEGSYAFVGPGDAATYLSPYGMTASKSATGGSGQLAGLLGRSPQAQFYPKLAGPSSALDMELPRLVYSGGRPWPDRDTPGHNTAIACIAASLSPALPMPMESNYTDDNPNWGVYEGQLAGFTYAKLSATCEGPFTEQDFDDVTAQLKAEWGYVATVGKLVDNLQKPLLAGYATFQAHITDVFHDIQRSVKPPDSSTSVSPEQITVDALWIASYIPGIGDVFGVTAGMGQLALDTTNDSNGIPEGDTFQANATDVPDKLADRLQDLYTEMDSVEDILMSDWGKLSTAAEKAVTDWQWDDRVDKGPATDVFDASMTKLAWESLFPLVYTTYEFGDSVPADARTYPCTGYSELDGYSPFYPFSDLPNAGYTVVVGAGPQTNLWAYGKVDDTFLKYRESDRDPNGTPSSDLFKAMFVNSPSGSTVEGPPLPSQLRFDLDAYDTRPVLTYVHNDQVPGSQFCAVNGSVP